MGFFALVRMFAIIFVFGIIFVNFLVMGVGHKDWAGGVKYLGVTFLQSTVSLQDESNKLIDRGTIIPVDATKLQVIWIFIKNIWNIFSAIFIIYMWLFILAKILLFFPIADTSKKFTAWVFAIIIFLMLQMVVVAKFTDKSFWTPILAFKDFGLAMYSLFAPVADRINNYANVTDNIST